MTVPEAVLKEVPLFQSFRVEDQKHIASLLRTQSLKKGDTLFRKGDEGTTFYLIIRGGIKIVRTSRDGKEIILALLSNGDFFGEMALLDGLSRSADAVAIEPTQLYVLNRKDFLSFVMHNENVLQSIITSLSLRLRRTDDFLEDACFMNISSRLAKKLVELAETRGHQEGDTAHIELHLTQKQLAGMIGATRESINKALRVLREKGLASVSEDTIRIHDLKRLKRRTR
jgi:CRP-like cAMP-binding protein